MASTSAFRTRPANRPSSRVLRASRSSSRTPRGRRGNSARACRRFAQSPASVISQNSSCRAGAEEKKRAAVLSDRAPVAARIFWVAALLFVGAAPAAAFSGPAVGGVAIEFILFALVLAAVALWHRHTLPIAVVGAVAIALYKIAVSPFREGSGVGGLAAHLGSESVLLTNLLLLLLGFALLANHFEKSRVPEILPRWLPDGWLGGFVLLVLVAVLSSFLDNIAAAMIGGTIAAAVFKRRVHVGYLAAIVAASNARGAGSVVGDTATTMIWIAGVKPSE